MEKLDNFLKSIESRLENFEQFFKVKSEETTKEDVIKEEPKRDFLNPNDHVQSHHRRGSSASMSSIKMYSLNYLSTMHQRLSIVKDSVLRSSFTNLENLYKSLDDQCTYLFSEEIEVPETDDMPTKEALTHKVIAIMLYFDEKLSQVDDYIRASRRFEDVSMLDESIFNQLRFFNFNKALKTAEKRLLHYYELPLGWRENKYIIHGYRFSMNHADMFKSVFSLNHNESMNIWTHIFGFFIMAWLTFVHFPSTAVYQNTTVRQKLCMWAFLAAGMNCLISSSVWHTYSCFAKLPTRLRCACVDYTGITLLITFSVISAEYCSLYHYPRLLNVYVGCSITSGLTGFIFNWSPYFDKPECRSLRIGFFVGLAFLGATTTFCVTYYEGFLATFHTFFPLFYKSFLWYWIGVVAYGALFPERLRYDVIIADDTRCSDCEYNTKDVLLDKMDRSGMDEMVHIGEELTDLAMREESGDIVMSPETHEEKLNEIITQHFQEKPTETPYAKEFMSLWWVDYVFSSHSIWHICVVMGVVGHYFSVLDMYKNVVLI